MVKINFGDGNLENIITRNEFSVEKARTIIGNTPIVMAGYGSQAPGQSLNLRDSGVKNVIISQRKGSNLW